jgi:flagellar biosynthetic protein FliR
MVTLNVSLGQVQGLMLIFLRIMALLMYLPLFENRQVPLGFKAGLAVALSFLLFPQLSPEFTTQAHTPLAFGIGVAGELLIGITLGLAVRLFFAGIQLAGQLAGFQMSLTVANVLDPVSNSQISIIPEINNLLTMLVFLAINAHHMLILALMESFERLPPLAMSLNRSLGQHMLQLAGGIFVAAFQVGAPLIVTMLIASVALGLMARTVPQMNVFLVAMPAKILVGFVVMALSVPYLVAYLKQAFGHLHQQLFLLLRLMQ